MKPTRAPDWAAMILQLRAKGMTFAQIGQGIQSMLTERMLKHYASGAQPAHWRGELLITLWCTTTKSTRESVPMCDLVRGHRAMRKEPEQGPRLQNLPQWPAVPKEKAKTKPKSKKTEAVGV